MKGRKNIPETDLNQLIRDLISDSIGKLLEAELEEFLGYPKHKRSSNPNSRNGHYSKTLNSPLGNITIDVPRDRFSEFNPKLVPKGSKSLVEDLQNKLMLLYSKGLSTRDIQDILKDIYGVELSPSTIYRLTDRIIPEIKEWLSRPLEPVYAFLFIDCTFVKVRLEGRVRNAAVYTVVGINPEGYKEILGFWMLETESASHWVSVLNDLKSRGVEDVLVVVADNLRGLEKAVRSVFPRADYQQCVVHKVRSSLRKVRYKDRRNVAKDMKAIYTQPTEQMARQKLEEFKSRWENKYPQVVREWEEDWEVITTFYRYPHEIRRCMSNTNLIESVYSKIKKVTDSKRVFPSEDSLMKVLYGVALELEELWKRSVRDWELIRSQLEMSMSR